MSLVKIEDIVEYLDGNYTGYNSPLWTADQFGGCLEDYFMDRYYFRSKSTIALTESDFKGRYTRWVSMMSANLTDIANALAQEYDPLANYDRTEVTTRENTGTVTTDIDTTHTGTVETAGEDSASSTNSRSGFNSATMVPTDSSSTGSETSATTTNDLADNTDTTRTDDLMEEVNSHISGNIGVTTSQQMLLSEIELRKNNYILEFITMFINACTLWQDPEEVI